MTACECGAAAFLRNWAAWGAGLVGMLPSEQPVTARASAWAALSHILARCANGAHAVQGHAESVCCGLTCCRATRPWISSCECIPAHPCLHLIAQIPLLVHLIQAGGLGGGAGRAPQWLRSNRQAGIAPGVHHPGLRCGVCVQTAQWSDCSTRLSRPHRSCRNPLRQT